jgi:hypothetical protein
MWGAVMRKLIGISLLLSACSAPDTGETEDAISTRTAAFVTLTRDTRRCIAPLCGGYWVTDVNKTNAPVYVSGFDFSESGLDEQSILHVQESLPEELVIRGRLGRKERQFDTRPLVVLEAYRGLPYVSVAAGDWFYSVSSNDPPITCITAPCNNDWATRLNRRFGPISFTGVSVANALRSFVDDEWLVNRIERGGALVAGQIVEGASFPGGPETILEASQVFLRLPESPGPCPQIRFPPCAEGFVRPTDRNGDRCVLPAGECVPEVACPEITASCDEGYQAVGWTGADGCSAYACDPSFAIDFTQLRCATVRCGAGTHCVEVGPDVCVSDWVSEEVLVGTPNPYRNNQRLGWIFTSDVPNTNAVRVHFASFDLEADYDFAIIQNEVGEELARYTGSLGEFTTDAFAGSSLVILFESDVSVTSSGFVIDRIDARPE